MKILSIQAEQWGVVVRFAGYKTVSLYKGKEYNEVTYENISRNKAHQYFTQVMALPEVKKFYQTN